MKWILVAHRSGARVYQTKGNSKALHLVKDIPHPEGNLKNRDIKSDRPGRAFDKVGGGRHSMSSAVEPKAQLEKVFAGQLSSMLDEARNQHLFDRLILVAEPRFLGELRGMLNRETAAMVTSTLDKDLMSLRDPELLEYLQDFLEG